MGSKNGQNQRSGCPRSHLLTFVEFSIDVFFFMSLGDSVKDLPQIENVSDFGMQFDFERLG